MNNDGWLWLFIYLLVSFFWLLIDELKHWYEKTAIFEDMNPCALQQQAEICNTKKQNARLIYDECCHLFYYLDVKVW